MRFLSGVQPSGELHLGNYFGAIEQHIALQDEGEAFYFIADYHALTTIRNPARLLELTREVAVAYLALGLDPQRAVFFRQSDIPEVTELTWILSTVTGMGLLERATSYKDKVARGIKSSIGLFLYPVLMASDILIYKPDLVPVGGDQTQHVEICQDIAGHFNSAYQEVFKRPEARINESGKKVPGLDGQKMSKSYDNAIPIFAEGKRLKKLCNAIVTDSTDFKTTPLNPNQCNVFALLKLLTTPQELSEISRQYRDDRAFGYGHAKIILREKITGRFAEARERRKELLAKPAEVEAVLQQGAQRARALAQQTLQEVRGACGLSNARPPTAFNAAPPM